MDFNSIIKETPEKIKEYLTPEKIREYGFDAYDVERLIKATGDIERYITPEIIKIGRLSAYQIKNLIIATGKVKKYLDDPSRLIKLGVEGYVGMLIKATGDIEPYLLKGQTKEDKNLSLSMLNVIKKLGIQELERCLENLEELEKLGGRRNDATSIVKLIKETSNPEKYITKEKRDLYQLNDEQVEEIMRVTGGIESYLTPEKIREYGFKSGKVVKLIKATGNVGKYITREVIETGELDNYDVESLIKATGDIERYITPEIIKIGRLSAYQVKNLIIATGKVGEYLGNPDRLIELGVQGYVGSLIKATGDIEPYLLKGQTKEDKNLNLSMLNVIKKLGIQELERCLENLEELEKLGVRRNDATSIVKLIKETSNPEKYITKEKRDLYQLNDEQVEEIMRVNGGIESYLTPEKIREYGFKSGKVVKLIKATGNVGKYINREVIEAGELDNYDVENLIKATGDIERYITPEMIKMGRLSAYQVKNLIIATGKVEEYLDDPSRLIKLGVEGYVSTLIKATGNIEPYLLKGQTKEDKNLRLSMLNVLKGLGIERFQEYLTPEKLYDLGITRSDDITKLIKETGNIEKYLFEGEKPENPKLQLDLTNIIKGLGTQRIEEYITPEALYKFGILNNKDITKLIKATGNIEKYLFDGQDKESQNLQLNMSNVIKGSNACPQLTQEDIKLLCSFDDIEIIQTVINLDIEKQKDAILILDSLSKSNSDELRRVKVPIALQILEKEPESYKETLNKIEEIYLTNNIPTVGKLYLVFQELHPNFLGEESGKKRDDSYANIPSLELATKAERKHIIFSDLLRCALESNSRNIRDYLDVIEQGNILYEQLLKGELKLEELDEKDPKIEMLSKYREILNSLYNVTSKGKRKENLRTNSGDVVKDLKELDSLFGEDLIDMNLPDRIIRTFAFGTGIRTFEQAKSIIEQMRENAHNRNAQVAQNGKIELKHGDFVKGIQKTQYFPAMLQKGILAKDFLGGNATHDATPLDTDVEKILEEGQSFNETLNKLTVARGFTSGNVDGKNLGTIMIVFSGEDFIETRDSSRKVNTSNVELLKQNPNKKEVFHNSGSAYGIRTGIGSTNIKCIIADRYVDKLGLEIAKNGFYIPIVDKEGKVIFTVEMYNEFRSKMQGLHYYGEDEFVIDETARNEGTRQIAELIDRNEQNARNKRNKILKTLEDAVKKIGCVLSKERKIDLTPGFIEFIDTGSTGRGTNEPGDGDFDFMVRMDKMLCNEPEKFKNALREVLSRVKPPKSKDETSDGDFRYKGVSIEGLDEEIDLDLTFSERTNAIEYSTDECIKERLKTIKTKSVEDYRYVVANILLAKKLLKKAEVYKKSNAAPPEKGQPDTRGGLGAVGIENWILQNGGSFMKAAESFINTANECKNFEEFRAKYSVWDFGENHRSAHRNMYPHDNFVYNMNSTGYEKMKVALTKYLEALKEEQRKGKSEHKIGIVDIVQQDISVLNDTPYMIAVRDIMAKQNRLEVTI